MRLPFNNLLMLGVIGVTGYFVYRAYQNRQRALAHPITQPSQFLQPITVDPALVGRVKM